MKLKPKFTLLARRVKGEHGLHLPRDFFKKGVMGGIHFTHLIITYGGCFCRS